MIARSPLPRPAIAGDVLQGLSRTPKSLPPKLFYDAAGSALFDRITTLPEYYLTRCEMEILERSGAEICDAIGSCGQVVELGPGNGSKAEALLRRLTGRQLRTEYVPLDISSDALGEAARRIAGAFSNIKVHPQVADFSRPFTLPDSAAGRLVLYLGSSIGNLEMAAAQDLLRRIRGSMRPGDKLLLGADLVKPAPVLRAAYDDRQGVTAAFNKNVLARINRELGGGFDLDSFRHIALWNRAASRMEMYLECLREQTVMVRALRRSFFFARGERIHTENSHKYTPATLRRLLKAADFRVERAWSDRRGWFALHLGAAE